MEYAELQQVAPGQGPVSNQGAGFSGLETAWRLRKAGFKSIRNDPIEEITARGVKTKNDFYEIDMLVVATGYDAVTGTLLRMNITGKDGMQLKDAWADLPRTYLGLMVAGFPNLFTITGPTSPSVLTNVIFAIDQHFNWISYCLQHMRRTGATEIDTTEEAQQEWQAHLLASSAGFPA